MADSALLIFEDGSQFYGRSIGVAGIRVGEVVFNTAMTGYQEILTDPSYAKQFVTLTYPHIGNTGINEEDIESRAVFCSGLVIRDTPRQASNFRQSQTLEGYLAANDVVAIAGVDTRQIARHIRTHGAMRACLVAGDVIDESEALAQAKAFPGLSGMDLAKEVTTAAPYQWEQGVWSLGSGYATNIEKKYRVVAIDFGVKHNILRILTSLGCDVEVVPATTDAETILAKKPDGVFLSNGPGDPEPCDYAITTIQKLLTENMPIFGICLGHQLLCLAAGAKTEKMKFGHHGANHPVQDLDTKQVFITSQNHGFTVSEQGMPDNIRITHRSLFDHTVQGIAFNDKPAYSFQGHPEASPGPMDINNLFDRFIQLMQK